MSRQHVASPDQPPPEELSFRAVSECRLRRRLAYLSLFIFAAFPLVLLALAAAFGGALALVEKGATFRDGFLYVISNLLGMANPLTEYVPPGVGAAVVVDVYVAVAQMISFGIMLNVVNLFEVPRSINKFVRKLVNNEICVSLIALCILIPAWNAGLCAIFGCVLAWVERWHVSEGFLYVITNVLGLGTPLTDVVPTTLGGKVIDICISSVALGYIAIFADYATTLNPSRYVRKRLYGCLGKLGVVDQRRTSEVHPLAREQRAPYELLD